MNTPGVKVRLEVPRQVAAKNSFRAVYNITIKNIVTHLSIHNF